MDDDQTFPVPELPNDPVGEDEEDIGGDLPQKPGVSK